MENIDNYTILSEIGGGNFGKVYKARNPQGEFFAIKKIQTRGINSKLRSLIENEKVILEHINHKAVLKFVQFIESNHFVYLVTELCEGGDLENYMRNYGPVNFETGRRWIRDLTEGLSTLKSKQILHRDFKVANLLMTHADPEKAEIKICDFGFSKFLSSSLTCTQLGTPLYMAPEIFTSHSYDYKIDIWSLGVVTYEILCGSPPFKCYNLEELKRQQRKELDFVDNPSLSEVAKDFIRKLLTYDPNLRPGYEEILQHEFLRVQKEEIVLDEEKDYDFCEDPQPEEVKIEESLEECINEIDVIPEKAISPSEVPINNSEGSFKEAVEPSLPNEITDVINPPKPSSEISQEVRSSSIMKQSILNFLAKEIQTLAMQINQEIVELKKFEQLSEEYKPNKELFYFLSLYQYKKQEELIQRIEAVRSVNPDSEELAQLLDETFVELQMKLITLEESIQESKSTDNFTDEQIRIKIITEGYDLVEDPVNQPKVQLLFAAGYFLYPGDEVIFEFLAQSTS